MIWVSGFEKVGSISLFCEGGEPSTTKQPALGCVRIKELRAQERKRTSLPKIKMKPHHSGDTDIKTTERGLSLSFISLSLSLPLYRCPPLSLSLSLSLCNRYV